MPEIKGYYIRHKGYDRSIKRLGKNFKHGFIQMILKSIKNGTSP